MSYLKDEELLDWNMTLDENFEEDVDDIAAVSMQFSTCFWKLRNFYLRTRFECAAALWWAYPPQTKLQSPPN